MMEVFATFSAFVFLAILPAYSASCSSTQYVYLSSFGNVQVKTSPNYPFSYPSPSIACRWSISGLSGYFVQLKFTNFNTYGSGSCSYPSDKVEVYDTSYESSSRRLGTYCGSSLPPTMISSGTYMYVKFTAYSLYPKTGFRMELSAVSKQSACGSSSLTASSSTTGVVTTPNYPSNYPTSVSCQWKITAPSGYVVQLKFTNFKIYGSSSGSCTSSSYDSLSIYDSSYAQSSKLLGKYCGSYVPGNLVSQGRYMYLKFSANSLFGRSGIRIEYKAVKDPAQDYTSCSVFNSYYTNNNIKLKASSSSYKYIKSPYYPNKYPSNIQCTWVISASSSSKRIKLVASSVNINNYYNSYSCSSTTADSLTIRDGSSSYSSKLKEFCSKSYSSSTWTSSGQKLWVRFKTNSDNYFSYSSTVGFEAKFIEIEEETTNVGLIVGILVGVGTFIGLMVCCYCCKRKGNAGHVQNPAPVVTRMQTTTTTVHPPPPAAAPQYPLQAGALPTGGYPPPMGNYPKQPLPQGSYPPTTVTYPPNSSYMYPQQPQSGHPPPPVGSHPPPPVGSHPPPPGGSHPPPPGGSHPPPPGGSYPPPPGGSLPQGGYPPPFPTADVPETPPPAYPGPPVYPTQSNQPYNPQFQGTQPNPPYPPPQRSENQAAIPYPVTSEKHGAPPQA